MSDVVIRADHLGKRYRIGRATRYRTIRESLAHAAATPWRGLRRRIVGRAASDAAADGAASAIWALKDISFEVKQGDVVGIIGRNGAGKSTLLKILSRITKPTAGLVELNGRVGSLLEVGTGFHSELSGRENIYLNGAILGMARAEIAGKFDQIVAFSEVEKFLDTPVKRYSSGMYMRLAFAVAAHLEPDILIVDEVLAVGDAAFQKKCLGKMGDVAKQGRTVLFVSHDMSAITRLCDRTILLDEGVVLDDGPSSTVVTKYLRSGLGTTAAREWADGPAGPGNDVARLAAVRVRDEDGRVAEAVDIRRPVAVEMEFEVFKPGYVLVPNFTFSTDDGVLAFYAIDHDPAWRRRPRELGRYVSTTWIPGNLLAEGTLLVGAALSTFEPVVVHFHERDAVAFQMVDSLEGDSARGDYAGPLPGIVRPLFRWTTNFAPAPPHRSKAGSSPALPPSTIA